MKLSDVMFSDLSEDQLKLLSDRERAMWQSRPRHGGSSAKIFMFIRVGLIVLAFLYFKNSSEARALVLLLGMYKFAYYTTARARLNLEYRAARERYVERAREQGLIPTARET